MSTHKRVSYSGMIPRMELSIDKLLSENLKRLFGKRSITSAAKAEESLKVPRSTIDRALNARGSSVRLETLAEIADGLKLEPWQLLVPDLDPENLPALQALANQPLLLGVLAQAQYADLWKIDATDMIRLVSEYATATSTGRAQILRMAAGAEKISASPAVSTPAN